MGNCYLGRFSLPVQQAYREEDAIEGGVEIWTAKRGDHSVIEESESEYSFKATFKVGFRSKVSDGPA